MLSSRTFSDGCAPSSSSVGSASLQRLTEKVAGEDARSGLTSVCVAACELGKAPAAAVLTWGGGRPHVEASSSLSEDQLRRLGRLLGARSAGRRALRQSDVAASAEHTLFALRLRGRRVGALYVEGLEGSPNVVLGVLQLARIADALLARAEAERTQRKERARLGAALAIANQQNVRLEAFASRVSHDLKTPLVAVKGYVEMLQRGMGGALTPAGQRYLERLARAVDRQKEIIDQQSAQARARDQDARQRSDALALCGAPAPQAAREHDERGDPHG